ncbi:SDR family oxidoreductase [Candidatus Dependentiae bacterium]|nr:SDR family oxidoreductase [Candidatus Dependentiae bacterium]
MNLTSKFDLKNKVIIVTGGAGHLGHIMSLSLADVGAYVIIACNDEEEYIDKIGKFKKNSISFQQFDISSTKSICNGFQKICENFGTIDVLINNAFYAKCSDPSNINDEDWQYSIDGVLGSVFRCTREIIPFMKRFNKGHIINIASMYGLVSPDFRIYKGYEKFFSAATYGAAKAGIIQLTKYFAVYLANNNINVNAISPGAFPSPIVQQEKGFINNLCEKIPMNRIGVPEDLIGAILFLSSDLSSYVTGQNIIIDGGLTVW